MENINLDLNTIFLGDRSITFNDIKQKVILNFFKIDLFEIEKLNISIDDVRRMISFANKTSEHVKVITLSSFYWSDEAQNAMLKVLEESPPNTHIYLFGLSEKNFLQTILSRTQKVCFKKSNRYAELAKEILSLEPNERLENKNVKKILALKTTDYNYEKSTENEKKDREAHILFLYALIDVIREDPRGSTKSFLEKILKISTLAEIEGGSPHLFIEWLLLTSPVINHTNS